MNADNRKVERRKLWERLCESLPEWLRLRGWRLINRERAWFKGNIDTVDCYGLNLYSDYGGFNLYDDKGRTIIRGSMPTTIFEFYLILNSIDPQLTETVNNEQTRVQKNHRWMPGDQ